jgi:D-arabinose 1-dehydrogenase-like Zn-dependent alcohol dehydrogenase
MRRAQIDNSADKQADARAFGAHEVLIVKEHRAALVDIVQLAAQGRVKPEVETYQLDEVNKVFIRLLEGKVRHRAVLIQNH